jgi:hypothetical protein
MQTATPNQFSIIDRGTIFSDEAHDNSTRVACFPSLTRLTDGAILCAYRVGSSKDSADETVWLSKSEDEGKTWTTLPFHPVTSLNGRAGSLRTGHVVELAPGHLLVHANWIERGVPGASISHPETGGCLPMKLVAFESKDGGETWSPMREVSGVPFEQPEISGPPIALSQPDHLLQPLENQKQYLDLRPIDEKCFALLSFDSGQTWPEWAMIAHDHPARKFWCNRVVRLSSGDLVCVSWTFDNETERDLPLHLTYGSPDGRQWEAPFSTGIHGQVSHLLPWDENTLLMATSHRESPAAIRLRTSFDGGKTWDGEGVLVFDAEAYASSSGGDLADYYAVMTEYTFGWSPMVRLSDGAVLLAYFAGTSEAMAIHWVKLAPCNM